MKKLVLGCLAIFMVVGLNIPGAYASENGVYVLNGNNQYFSAESITQNGTTLVPLRGVFETLGATVVWNQKDKTITAQKDNKKVWLKVGSKSAKVNGNAVVISIAPKVTEGKVLVPLRFVSEALNAKVDWNKDAASIKIVGSNSVNQNMSNWLGDYYNSGYSGTGFYTGLVVNQKTASTIKFTPKTGYRYDPTTTQNLAGYQMPWKFSYEQQLEAKLTSTTTAKFNSQGCTFDMELVGNSIYVENMSNGCGFTNIAESLDEYSNYDK